MYHVKSYLENIRSQTNALARSTMIIDTVKDFKTGYHKFDNQKITPEWEKKIKGYYNKEFIPKLEKTSVIKNSPPVTELFLPESNASKYLQYQYIVNNPHPVGKKYELDDAKDNTDYNKTHKKYNYSFRKIVEKLKFKDLVLIDPDTSDIIYTTIMYPKVKTSNLRN